MNQIEIFKNPEFGAIRAVEIDGEPWLVGKDIALALGYKNAKDALATHVDAEDKRIVQRSENATFDIPNRGITIINESGFYSLVLSSKLPKAKQFRRWVTSEVLPTIIIPLRNMINEAYAMDIARKIKAQQRRAMKDGKYVGARTPYGYLKAPDDCHQLIVDPVAAEVVKTMFQWAAEGAGLNTIAVRLNEAGYLSPSHYKRTLGEITQENLVGNGHWQTRTVAKILRAEVYTGDLVQGVSKIIDHKQVRASADEWTTVRGTHEAIISRELFAAVQKALDQAAQQAKDREIHSWSPNLLRGKIFCAHCGHSLHRQKCVRRKSQEVYVYHCISNNRIKKGVCPGVFIFEKELLDALADMIQEQLDTTLGQYSLSLENLTKEAEEQKNIQAKIFSRKQEIQQLRTYQRGLYEGLIQNHLSKDEYFTFKEKYEAKIEAISGEIEQLKAGLAIIAKQLEQYKMLSQDAQHIKEDRQLTAALIDRLIDCVEVSREKRITVRFRFQSEFEHCEEVLSQCRNM